MSNGLHSSKHENDNRKRFRTGKPLLLIVSLILIVTLAAGGTFAFLKASSEPVINTFTAGTGGIDIDEDKSNNVKTSIRISNTGDVPVYIRLAVVANHVDDNGNVVAGDAISIPNTDQWQLVDGYYYYKGIAAPGQVIEFLQSPLDYNNKEINVIAQAIQAAGGFVQEKWGHSYDSGTQSWN